MTVESRDQAKRVVGERSFLNRASDVRFIPGARVAWSDGCQLVTWRADSGLSHLSMPNDRGPVGRSVDEAELDQHDRADGVFGGGDDVAVHEVFGIEDVDSDVVVVGVVEESVGEVPMASPPLLDVGGAQHGGSRRTSAVRRRGPMR